MNAVWKRVGELATLDPATFGPYVERRDAIRTELEELAFACRDYASNLDSSPDRLQQIEDRLAQIERLKRRYGPTLDEVIQKRAAVDAELASLDTSADRAAELERQLAEARDAYLKAARELSKARKDAATKLGRQLETHLEELAMTGTQVQVRLASLEQTEEEWTDSGLDRVELYMSPNRGEEVRPLARIASGGELSRVMLAIKTLASPDVPGKTLIFDEVDAGIGGRVADVVGSRVAGAGGEVSGVLHHPSAAGRGLRAVAFPGLEAHREGPHGDAGRAVKKRSPRRRNCAHDGRTRDHAGRARGRRRHAPDARHRRVRGGQGERRKRKCCAREGRKRKS